MFNGTLANAGHPSTALALGAWKVAEVTGGACHALQHPLLAATVKSAVLASVETISIIEEQRRGVPGVAMACRQRGNAASGNTSIATRTTTTSLE